MRLTMRERRERRVSSEQNLRFSSDKFQNFGGRRLRKTERTSGFGKFIRVLLAAAWRM
jgi:hypothetical protein